MHIQLTDLLCCPGCGPSWGLILLGERIESRRVLEGRLGCPSCRETYRISGGFADLRPAPAVLPDRPVPQVDTDPADAFRLAALMGVQEGPGFMLVLGQEAELAPGIAEIVTGIEVVAVAAGLAGWAEAPGVSRLAAGRRLPFCSSMLRAVALGRDEAGPYLAEGARVLAPLGRLVLLDRPETLESHLGPAGLEEIAGDEAVVVAVKRRMPEPGADG